MTIAAIQSDLQAEYMPIATTSDDAMMMSLPPCCRGAGCGNMTGSMSSSGMADAFHESAPVAQAADSIGLSRETQAMLDHRFATEYGGQRGRAVFATFVAKLQHEASSQRQHDVTLLNQQYAKEQTQ
jgi:hypothetical protein